MSSQQDVSYFSHFRTKIVSNAFYRNLGIFLSAAKADICNIVPEFHFVLATKEVI